MAPLGRVCAHHPERPGHALCMDCRKGVCAECATDWDGVNYCAPCIERRRQRLRSHRRWPGLVLLAVASVLLLLAAARLTVWTGVVLAGLR